jgi:hypothetical protein
MKKVIRLTERDLVRIVKRVIKENNTPERVRTRRDDFDMNEGIGSFIGNKIKNLISGPEEKLYRNELLPLLNKLGPEYKDLVERYKTLSTELFDAVDASIGGGDEYQPFNPYTHIRKRKRLRSELIELTKVLNDKLGDSSLDGYITKIENLYDRQNDKDDKY